MKRINAPLFVHLSFMALTFYAVLTTNRYKDIAWTGLDDMPEFVTAVPNIADRTRIKNRIKAESTGQLSGEYIR